LLCLCLRNHKQIKDENKKGFEQIQDFII